MQIEVLFSSSSQSTLLQSPHLRAALTDSICCFTDPPQIVFPDIDQRHLNSVIRFLLTGNLMGLNPELTYLRSILTDVLGFSNGLAMTPVDAATGEDVPLHDCPFDSSRHKKEDLWEHMLADLDRFLVEAKERVEKHASVTCCVCKNKLNYMTKDEIFEKMYATVEEHYKDHHRRLKKNIFTTVRRSHKFAAAFNARLLLLLCVSSGQ